MQEESLPKTFVWCALSVGVTPYAQNYLCNTIAAFPYFDQFMIRKTFDVWAVEPDNYVMKTSKRCPFLSFVFRLKETRKGNVLIDAILEL